jgi:hypothetical protein
MVKVIKLQKPFPKAVLTAIGDAPFAIAATATITTAMTTKMNASGNQRSAHAVKPIAMRTSTPSCWVAPPDGSIALVIAMVKSSRNFLIDMRRGLDASPCLHNRISGT